MDSENAVVPEVVVPDSRAPIGSASRRAYQNAAAKRSRERHRPKDAPETTPEYQSTLWPKNAMALQKDDPSLYDELIQRHEDVVWLEARTSGLAVEINQDPVDIAEALVENFRNVKADVQKFGSCNYRELESAFPTFPLCPRPDWSSPYASVTSYKDNIDAERYFKFGFRTRLSHDLLQDSRETLVLYALRTHDPNVNADAIREAIQDCEQFQVFSPNKEELRKLIRESQPQPERQFHV